MPVMLVNVSLTIEALQKKKHAKNKNLVTRLFVVI